LEFNEEDELVKGYIAKGRPSMVSIVEKLKWRGVGYYYLERCKKFYDKVVELGLPTNFYTEMSSMYMIAGEGDFDKVVDDYRVRYSENTRRLPTAMLCKKCLL